ncbi:MAG: hypothetical protein KW793_03935 [Candidatus Doudnabacteria bacterium]|nr:hypothetical protein [Candidatus Doudnabacteria bacterium]
MKKLIQWLADVSGVTRDIEIKSIKMVGGCMFQNAYWWNGGMVYQKMNSVAWNSFFLYAEGLKLGNHSPDINRIRDDVYRMEKENRTIDPNSSIPITHQPLNPDAKEYAERIRRLKQIENHEMFKRMADKDNIVEKTKKP